MITKKDRKKIGEIIQDSIVNVLKESVNFSEILDTPPEIMNSYDKDVWDLICELTTIIESRIDKELVKHGK